MDNIWIFLVIIGAVLSMAQKNQQKNRPAEQNDDPTLDPQAEWERRIKELFGEDKSAETATAENRPAPTAQKSTEPTSSQKMAQPKATTTPSSPKQATSLSRSYHSTKITPSLTNSQRGHAAGVVNKSTHSNPIKEGDITAPKTEIDHILEDFTMEKAVIYSEILRPKFED